MSAFAWKLSPVTHTFFQALYGGMTALRKMQLSFLLQIGQYMI